MKKQRNLSGVWFRAERDGKWTNICFEDLTPSEQMKYLENRSEYWLKSLIVQLADTINEIGETTQIVKE